MHLHSSLVAQGRVVFEGLERSFGTHETIRKARVLETML